MSDYGACIIAYGDKAEREAAECVRYLETAGVARTQYAPNGRDDFDNVQRSRFAKVTMTDWTPFALTLYTDADTRAYSPDVTVGFDLLSDGWEMVVTPSPQQGDESLWHVGEEERAFTFDAWGTAHILQLQCGVMWFAMCERVREFFGAWREEWERWAGQDQAAFLRALNRYPLRLWLMGRPFNGGAVVGHRWGTLR